MISDIHSRIIHGSRLPMGFVILLQGSMWTFLGIRTTAPCCHYTIIHWIYHVLSSRQMQLMYIRYCKVRYLKMTLTYSGKSMPSWLEHLHTSTTVSVVSRHSAASKCFLWLQGKLCWCFCWCFPHFWYTLLEKILMARLEDRTNPYSSCDFSPPHRWLRDFYQSKHCTDLISGQITQTLSCS